MRRNERGAAAVEMVIMAPLLLLILSLVVGAGRLTSTKQAVVQVAREAARIASGAPDAPTARSRATTRANDVAEELGLDPSRMTVRVALGAYARGDVFNVRITYSLRLSDLPTFARLPGSVSVVASQNETVERYISR